MFEVFGIGSDFGGIMERCTNYSSNRGAKRQFWNEMFELFELSGAILAKLLGDARIIRVKGTVWRSRSLLKEEGGDSTISLLFRLDSTIVTGGPKVMKNLKILGKIHNIIGVRLVRIFGKIGVLRNNMESAEEDNEFGK
ncbi:hypothetical protein DFP95_1392 [Cohnella lupini]|uniref:Uncharacterized protein n=1 Tax=Cohnella lupini TaxID=1294267 RepID=A0A3D9HQT0_9BACL|nr:hypothetical protein DFP95_1392 [Cohnella lupini]